MMEYGLFPARYMNVIRPLDGNLISPIVKLSKGASLASDFRCIVGTRSFTKRLLT